MAQTRGSLIADRAPLANASERELREKPLACSPRFSSGNQASLRRLALGGRPLQAKLRIGAVNDPLERAADAAADRVMRMADPLAPPSSGAPALFRKCASCDEEKEELQREAAGAGIAGAAVPPIVSAVLDSPGRPLDPRTRDFMASRFGADFSDVRIHTDALAARSAAEVDARAYTVGRDIAFAAGQYDPSGNAGRHLIAHELAHVLQDRPARRQIRRKSPDPTATDPLCGKYVFATDESTLEIDVDTLAATGDIEVELKVIQDLKIFRRCADETQIAQIHSVLKKLGAAKADALWSAAGMAFGGYRGIYPGYYSGRKLLSSLGTSEIEATPTFDYPEPSISPSIFDPRGEKIAPQMAKMIERADILYFYGHQYAQYGNPGAFANGSQDKFIDIRKLQTKGNFSRVKLLVSSSCATICKEALDVFTPLFPNAVILGYRKSAPAQGEAVRESFDKGIRDLKKPLLLSEPVDVAAIIGVWKSVVEKHHPKESERLPGYYEGGTVHFLRDGVWESMPAGDPANSCKKKGTEIQQARHHGQP